MKIFLKFGCLGIIALVILIVIISVASGGKDSTPKSTGTDTNKQTPSSTTQNTGKSDNKSTAKSGVLTKEKFAKIKDGMTYNEVTKIVGAQGEVLSESGQKGSPYHTIMYQFKTDGFMSSSIMTFQGGKLVNKSQAGLGGDSNATITKAEFEKIQNGMTYDQVKKIVGGAGEVTSESGKKGSEFYTLLITYKGEGDLEANANFQFQGGKLQNKAQFGLK